MKLTKNPKRIRKEVNIREYALCHNEQFQIQIKWTNS